MTNIRSFSYAKQSLWVWLVVLLYITAINTWAQDMQSAVSEEAKISEINGLVVDETITKAGRDFYEVFYGQWEAPASAMSYTIFIKELPLAGRGSQVMIYMDDTEVFNQAVQPRYEVIEEMAAYAVSLVTHYVVNYESMSRELGNEDQQGSGIF